MRSTLRTTLLVGAIALGAAPATLIMGPAAAQQVSVSIGFDTFHDQLGAHGYWLYSDRWGTVWQPRDVGYDFRPYYTDGRWVYTSDYGWMWTSDYDWGDIAFHYGRWVNDPDDGWLWIPGYTWGPAWVVWRTNQDYIGWMPMPPDEGFLSGGGDVTGGVSISFSFGNDPYYGYRRWYGGRYDDRRFASNWVFVDYGGMADRDYRRHAITDPGRVVNIVHRTKTVTNYTVVNNYVVNKGVDVRQVERNARRPVQVVQARSVMRNPNLLTRVDTGHRIRQRERAFAPVGTGVPNSAPPPSRQVVEKLSTEAPKRRGGGQGARLYTKTDVSNPNVINRFRGRGGAQGATPGLGENQGRGPEAGASPQGGPATMGRINRGQGPDAQDRGPGRRGEGMQSPDAKDGKADETPGAMGRIQRGKRMQTPGAENETRGPNATGRRGEGMQGPDAKDGKADETPGAMGRVQRGQRMQTPGAENETSTRGPNAMGRRGEGMQGPDAKDDKAGDTPGAMGRVQRGQRMQTPGAENEVPRRNPDAMGRRGNEAPPPDAGRGAGDNPSMMGRRGQGTREPDARDGGPAGGPARIGRVQRGQDESAPVGGSDATPRRGEGPGARTGAASDDRPSEGRRRGGPPEEPRQKNKDKDRNNEPD